MCRLARAPRTSSSDNASASWKCGWVCHSPSTLAPLGIRLSANAVFTTHSLWPRHPKSCVTALSISAVLSIDETEVLVLRRTRAVGRELLANVEQHFIFEARLLASHRPPAAGTLAANSIHAGAEYPERMAPDMSNSRSMHGCLARRFRERRVGVQSPARDLPSLCRRFFVLRGDLFPIWTTPPRRESSSSGAFTSMLRQRAAQRSGWRGRRAVARLRRAALHGRPPRRVARQDQAVESRLAGLRSSKKAISASASSRCVGRLETPRASPASSPPSRDAAINSWRRCASRLR